MIERYDPAMKSANRAHLCFSEDHRQRYRRAAELIRDGFGVPEDKRPPRILDAASGTGYGAEFLAPLGEYIGLDFSKEAVFHAKQEQPGSRFFICDFDADVAFLKRHSPDIVVSLETAEHLVDPGRFLDEVYWSLPVHGGFIFSVPTCLTRDFDQYHLRDWSARRWGAMLRRHRFRIIRIESTPVVVRFREDAFTLFPLNLERLLGVAKFWITHPWYAADRVVNWGVLNRFHWTSTMFVCKKDD